VRTGHAYVKVSGAYRSSTQLPDYADVAPLAKALIAANPQQVLWGTDWPHPDSSPVPGRKPTDVAPLLPIDDGRVFNQLATWAPGVLQRVCGIRLLSCGGVEYIRLYEKRLAREVGHQQRVGVLVAGDAVQVDRHRSVFENHLLVDGFDLQRLRILRQRIRHDRVRPSNRVMIERLGPLLRDDRE